MVPDELNQFPHDHPQHRQQVMDSIINKYSDHLPPQVRQSSPPKYNIYDQNLNQDIMHDSLYQPLQHSSNGPMKASDGSSMNSVYHRIQNLRNSILN
jgi:hypothetical protein